MNPCAEVEKTHEKLLKGLNTFRTHVFPQKRAAYRRMMREGQKPHTLFITCADSRIEPALLTQTEPGEIFVCRNIGNLIPAYPEMLGGISAVVEYAVSVLNVKMVVICGHSDCGAMRCLLDPDLLKTMPTVKSWLKNAEEALSIAREHAGADGHISLDAFVQQNVLLQLRHLRTHPSVAGKLQEKSIGVAGWFYDIAHGAVSVYDEHSGAFEEVLAPD